MTDIQVGGDHSGGEYCIFPTPPLLIEVAFDALDALALWHNDSQAITSPNCEHIPRPFIFGEEILQARADGRYGFVDIYQWPQSLDNLYPYSMVIPVRDAFTSSHPLSWAWYTPSYDHFKITDQRQGFGLLDNDKLKALGLMVVATQTRYKEFVRSKGAANMTGSQALNLLQTLRTCWAQLDRSPRGWRDTVAALAEFQRAVLECQAYFDYFEFIDPRISVPPYPPVEVNTRWMGCFATTAITAQKIFQAGVPCWYIRPRSTITSKTIVKSVVPLTEPHGIVTAMFTDPIKGFAIPYPVRFRGPAGKDRFLANRMYNWPAEEPLVPCEDISSIPQPSSTRLPARRQKSSQARAHASRPCTSALISARLHCNINVTFKIPPSRIVRRVRPRRETNGKI